MFEDLKLTWHHLRVAEPGARFQEYHRAHQAKHRGRWSGVVSVVIGVVIVAVGIVGLPAPGPGMLVIVIGAALIARESRGMARSLDWLEVRLRAAYRWSQRVWKRASPVQRMVVALAGVGIVGAAVYVAYSVTLGA